MSNHCIGSAKQVVVESPASSANVGPGFDVFALALDSPKDRVTLRLRGEGLKLSVEGKGFEHIPTFADSNTAGVVAARMIEDFKLPGGIEVKIVKGVPVAMGMGSSAASAAAVAFAVNKLFSLNLDANTLVKYAAEGELASAGKPHADNVSASLLGGFTIIRSYDPIDVIKIDPPEDLGICIASPHISYGDKKTAQFRAVIPSSIELRKLVHNVGNASALVAAIFRKDLKMFGRALDDSVVEPARSRLIPGYHEVKRVAVENGALGVTISGAGPSMAAFFDNSLTDGTQIGNMMCKAFRKAHVEASYYIARPGEGTVIVDKSWA
ncbi:MAG: homoserine kinase [Nitrososphaeria archaeon]